MNHRPSGSLPVMKAREILQLKIRYANRLIGQLGNPIVRFIQFQVNIDNPEKSLSGKRP